MCSFTSKAYKAGSITPFYPYGTLGILSSAANPIGRLASDIASAFVLTSTANTPAAASPASLTVTKGIVAASASLRLLFTSRVRDVPIQLAMLPVDSTGIRWFTTTALLITAGLSLLLGGGLMG